LDAISAISIIKNQERQYSEIVGRSAGLLKKNVLRRSTPKGDVRIYSEDDEQVSEDVASSQLWDVRGPKLLKEKSALDQRIKSLTQSYSEERLYTNRRLGEKDEEIEALNSRVSDLLMQLGSARPELKLKVPLLGSVLANVTSYFRGSGPLISYLIPGVVLVLLVLLFIRRQSVKRTKTEEVLEEESIESDLALKIAEGPSEPIISLNVPEDYDFESEEESYTASTKINLAKANIEIDKIQAAKDILKEVIDEGDVEEKKKAETLLKSIDEDPVK
jgi:FimV-like protein